MNLDHTLHRHGGRIIEVTRIEHGPVSSERRAALTWWIMGRVKWDDGSGDGTREIEISPTAFVWEDLDGHREITRVMAALNLYLSERGVWSVRGNGWKGFERTGSAEIDPLIERVDAGEG